MIRSLLVAALLTTACVASRHAELPAELPAPSAADWSSLIDTPGPIELTSLSSATWEVGLKGLVDLEHPAATSLQNGKTPIVLPLHLLKHPEHGLYVVDTGISEARARGEKDEARGLLRGFVKGMKPATSLGAAVQAQGQPLRGVLITHMHLDHVMGLGDVPTGVPIYVGPGEQAERKVEYMLVKGTYRRLLKDRGPLRVWPFEQGRSLGAVPKAVDVLGDGSLFALSVPGHTPGSTAYLARTTQGPVLMTGDCSHTRWGWDHDVSPGTFTSDHDANVQSLGWLRALSAQHPTMKVFVGHELGEGTGVQGLLAKQGA